MKLENYMRRYGLMDRDIAAYIKRDRSTINRVRRGKQMPDWPTMIAIREATAGLVSPNDFLPKS